MPSAGIDSSNNFSLEDLSALLNTTEHADEFASPGNFLLDLMNKKDATHNLLSHVPGFQPQQPGQNIDHFVNVSIPGLSPSAAIAALQYPSPVTPASFSSPKQMLTPTNVPELDHLSWQVRPRCYESRAVVFGWSNVFCELILVAMRAERLGGNEYGHDGSASLWLGRRLHANRGRP